MRFNAILGVLVTSVLCQSVTMLAQQSASSAPPHVLTCSRSFVVESQVTMAANGSVRFTPVWTWTPQKSKKMPPELANNFSTINECKPASGGAELLVTSSHDAIAVISRPSGDALFSAIVKNAHSAVLLPNHLIAVASSDATDGTGDRIIFFDRGVSNVRLAELPFHAAHGLVWDQRRQVLWADGFDQPADIRVDGRHTVVTFLLLP